MEDGRPIGHQVIASRHIANLAANFIGTAGAAILPLLFSVAYLRILGQENFGLITFYNTLFLFASLLDMGMGQSTVRELARRTSERDSLGEIQSVVFTMQIIFTSAGALIALPPILLSGWLATSWLKASSLAPDEISLAVALMGGMVAFSFCNIVLNATLRGLQRQVASNVFSVFSTATRGLVTIFSLYVVGTTPAVFFSTQLIYSGVETAALTATVWSRLPPRRGRLHFNFKIVRDSWKFAMANGLAVLIGQLMMMADKLVLSVLLPLELFGLYGFATTVATAIQKLATPFTNAYFPHFVELVHSNNQSALSASYHSISALASSLLISAGLTIAIYSYPILVILLGNTETASTLAPVLAMLALANTINCLMWIPHTLQLANGAAWIALRINAIQCVFYLPALIALVPHFSIYAPAGLWLVVNAINFPIFIIMTHRVALRGDDWIWVKNVVLKPSIVATLVLAVGIYMLPPLLSIVLKVGWICLNGSLTLAAAVLSSGRAREYVLQIFRQLVQTRSARPPDTQ